MPSAWRWVLLSVIVWLSPVILLESRASITALCTISETFRFPTLVMTVQHGAPSAMISTAANGSCTLYVVLLCTVSMST
jgi:hypothetical protein